MFSIIVSSVALHILYITKHDSGNCVHALCWSAKETGQELQTARAYQKPEPTQCLGFLSALKELTQQCRCGVLGPTWEVYAPQPRAGSCPVCWHPHPHLLFSILLCARGVPCSALKFVSASHRESSLPMQVLFWNSISGFRY